MDPATTDTHTADLRELRRRRAELREAIGALENALAAPASGRAVVWGERVHAALAEIADDFSEHVEVTEGPEGLHQSILAGDLRLANAVASLPGEHAHIATDNAGLIAGTEPPVTSEDVEGVRKRGTALLGRLIRHRQRGADLADRPGQRRREGVGHLSRVFDQRRPQRAHRPGFVQRVPSRVVSDSTCVHVAGTALQIHPRKHCPYD